MEMIGVTENKSLFNVINNMFDWLIHMIGYALILIIISFVFKKTVYIDEGIFGLWGLIAAIIIYILNKTVKPLIVWLTLPITGITLGIFYPFINLFVLKIVDWILGSHFAINGLWVALIVAILISIMNVIMEEVIINPIFRKAK